MIGMSVSKETFEKQMAYIYRNHSVIGLDDFIKYLAGKGVIPSASVVLTFDDGLKDNHDVALPILKKYGFTATFFLIGNSTKGLRSVWLHLLYEILDELSGKQVTWIFGDRIIFKTEYLDHKEKLTFAHEVKSKLSKLPSNKRNDVLKDICNQNGIEYGDIIKHRVFMSLNEIRALLKSGNLIGAHSMSHNCLADLPETAKKHEEIFKSMETVKQFGVTDFIPFSYPHGTRSSYDHETKDFVKNSGMSCAVTTIEGLNDPNTDPYELKRIEIGNFGRMEFVAHLSGVVGDIKIMLKKIIKRD
jgi:peptidoglycan/xylan/chitin deacetylase (PgdA/CDA1 family)